MRHSVPTSGGWRGVCVDDNFVPLAACNSSKQSAWGSVLKRFMVRVALNETSPMTELPDVTCHMGSHSVRPTCHPTQVNVSRLAPVSVSIWTEQMHKLCWLWRNKHLISTAIISKTSLRSFSNMPNLNKCLYTMFYLRIVARTRRNMKHTDIHLIWVRPKRNIVVELKAFVHYLC